MPPSARECGATPSQVGTHGEMNAKGLFEVGMHGVRKIQPQHADRRLPAQSNACAHVHAEVIPAKRVSDVLSAALEAEPSADHNGFVLPKIEPKGADSPSEPLIAKEQGE